MILETGQFTGPNGLIDKVRIFLAAQGWVTNRNTDDTQRYAGTAPSPLGKRLHMQLGTNSFWNFRSAYWEAISGWNSSAGSTLGRNSNLGHGLAANVSTGFNTANNWDVQPGYTQLVVTGSAGGFIPCDNVALNYRFFYATLPQLFFGIAVECQPEVWGHMWLGQVRKFGTWPGGDFCAASQATYFPNPAALAGVSWTVPRPAQPPFKGNFANANGACALRVTGSALGYDAYGAGYRLMGYPVDARLTTHPTALQNYSHDWQPLMHMPNSFSGVLPLVPVRFAVNASGTLTNGHEYLGELDHVYFTRMEGFATAETRTYQNRTFRFFPACDRLDGYLTLGLAYEVTT